jgi:[ribosomal protein S18]-alanine N-acetyltransferase
MKTLRFEVLQEAHIPAILDIERQVNTAPWSERSFRNELTHTHGVFLAAIADGQVAGYGGFWMVIDEAHITTVAVSPEKQRQGVGKRMMVELLTRAKEKNMACSTLEVRAGNVPAIQLYEKLGYVTAARRKNYYPDNQEDALVMWLHGLPEWEPPKL